MLLFALSNNLISEKKTKIPLKKTERDVRLLETFLKTKDEDRTIEGILAFELNECICQFISVRTKDGNVYEPISLRSLKVQGKPFSKFRFCIFIDIIVLNILSSAFIIHSFCVERFILS